jgi:hypothetical protein
LQVTTDFAHSSICKAEDEAGILSNSECHLPLRLRGLAGSVQPPAQDADQSGRPPQSVAIAPDESFALVTAATKLDPADKKKTAPHNMASST